MAAKKAVAKPAAEEPKAEKAAGSKNVIITSKIGRVSFPAVYEKSDFTEKFELNLVWGPDVDLAELEEAIEAAIKAEWPTKRPKSIKVPLKDISEKPNLGDFPDGSRFARFWRATRPKVVDQNKAPITEESGDFYAGCYARVSFNVFAGTNPKGGPYVALGLVNVQKVADGESFSGVSSNPEDDFDELPADLAELLDDDE